MNAYENRAPMARGTHDWRRRPPTQDEVDAFVRAHPDGMWQVIGPSFLLGSEPATWKTRWNDVAGHPGPTFQGNQHNKACAPIVPSVTGGFVAVPWPVVAVPLTVLGPRPLIAADGRQGFSFWCPACTQHRLAVIGQPMSYDAARLFETMTLGTSYQIAEHLHVHIENGSVQPLEGRATWF